MATIQSNKCSHNFTNKKLFCICDLRNDNFCMYVCIYVCIKIKVYKFIALHDVIQ